VTVQGLTISSGCRGREAEIARVIRAAFENRYGTGESEVVLVEALRRDGDVAAELVALEEGAVVGHAMFSRALAEPALCRIAGLAPVAARIDRQGRGIGGALIRAGLKACADQGCEAVIVLGDVEYYGRFGFSAALASGLASPYAGPHFQALELSPGALDGVRAVRYARAFQSAGS
jgi:putative acetyltransferase